MTPLRSRRSTGRLKRLYDEASIVARTGAWECRLDTGELTWTDGVYDLFGLRRGIRLERAATVAQYLPDSRRQMEGLRAAAIDSGGRFVLDAQIQTPHGEIRWMRLAAAIEESRGRPVRLYGAKQDVTAEKAAWEELRRLAECDPLTGLANRNVFEVRLGEWLRDSDAPTALALVDLDHFKAINDTYGHAAGDACLREAASRLSRALPDASLAARIGGDEFAILLRGSGGRRSIERLLASLLRTLSRPVLWHGHAIPLEASIGVTLSAAARTPSDLFMEADAALYAAKARGRHAVRFFGDGRADMVGHEPLGRIVA